jgi:hypothetical protein
MLKKIFANLFDRKNGKLNFKLDFVQGHINHNEIKNIKAGQCLLNFENQAFEIKQGDEIISEKMSDVYNVRTWEYKGNFYFAISMKTYSEYMFSFGEVSFWLKALENYVKAFDIPFEYSDESNEDNDE